MVIACKEKINSQRTSASVTCELMYKLAHTLSQNTRTHLFTKSILKLDGVISCHTNGITAIWRVATNSLHHNHASQSQLQHQCSEKFDVCVYQIPP